MYKNQFNFCIVVTSDQEKSFVKVPLIIEIKMYLGPNLKAMQEKNVKTFLNI